MPLSDFKSLETGHFVVWTLWYSTPMEHDRVSDARRDRQMAEYDRRDVRMHTDKQTFYQRVRVGWHRNEASARRIHELLRDEVAVYEWGKAGKFKKSTVSPFGTLELKKEVCVFDGDSFHSLTGHVWKLEDVESCIQRFEAASDEEILLMFGKHPREWRPCWLCCFCCLTCLWCCDQGQGWSKRKGACC